MKLVMIYCTRFAFKPTIKTLDEYPDFEGITEYKDVLAAYIHVEKEDEDDIAGIEKKLVKNLKWAAKKNNTSFIVLHSFSHLSESKATHRAAKQIFDLAEKRLQNATYETAQTPFGYFLDLDMQAPGISQARIFKSL